MSALMNLCGNNSPQSCWNAEYGVELQELYKSPAMEIGSDVKKIIEWCSHDAMCKELVKDGADAVYNHYKNKLPENLSEMKFNHTLYTKVHKIEDMAASKIGATLEDVTVHFVEWCEFNDAECKVLVADFEKDAIKAEEDIMNLVHHHQFML